MKRIEPLSRCRLAPHARRSRFWATYAIALWALLLCSAWASSALATNSHDHLYSVPLPEDFLPVSKTIFELPERSQRLSRFFKDADGVKFLLGAAGVAPASIRAIQKLDWKQATLKKACQLINPKSPKRALKYFLGVQKVKGRYKLKDNESRGRQYVIIENIRRSLLLSLDVVAVATIFKNYFQRDGAQINESNLPIQDFETAEEHEKDREMIHFAQWDISVPRQFFEGDQFKKLKLIELIALSHGIALSYYLSIPRRSFLTEGLKSAFEHTNHFEDGLIDGIDITGSLFGDLVNQFDYVDIARAFSQLFDYVHLNKLNIRVHAFESANSGSFYDGLRLALQNWGRNPNRLQLRIAFGHATRVTESWANFLKTETDIFYRFDFNLASQEYLQPDVDFDAVILKLFGHKDAINRTGSVQLGSDGRGILQSAGFVDQFERISNILLRHGALCETLWFDTSTQRYSVEPLKTWAQR